MPVGVTMSEASVLLTVPEVAERLRVSQFTVREWLKAGKLRGLRPGGTRMGWRIRESDLEAFLTTTEYQPESGDADIQEPAP